MYVPKLSKKAFFDSFRPELKVSSPGRINIIGEHVDYNMGLVLPAAIDHCTILQFQRQEQTDFCEVYSQNMDAGFSFHLKSLEKSAVGWENYILGVVQELRQSSSGLKGFKCHISSTIPTGSGLSSSAALECGLAYGLNTLFNLGLTHLQLVELCRKAEHTFVGTQCGIMDQYACIFGKKGQVLLLDCETRQHTYIPFKGDPYNLVVLNTNVNHSLADGQYNLRRHQCRQGLSLIQEKYPNISSLRHATVNILLELKDQMPATVFNRCLYVVEENLRVLKALERIKANDFMGLGQLLLETHAGLRDLYEVSCAELDFLVAASLSYDGVPGARMMGGGFGGCTLQLVHKEQAHAYIKSIAHRYRKEFGLALSGFVANIGQGTHIVVD